MNTNKTFEKSFIKNASLKTLRRTKKYALPIILVLSMVLVLLCATASADTVTLRPDGPGAYTEWDKSGCTANWECVDEITPDEDSTYVYTATTGAQELYSLTDSGLSGLPETAYIKSVSNCFRGRKTTSTGTTFWPLIRTHDTVFEGGVGGQSETYYNHCRSHSTNPYTVKRWTIAEVDALQAGIKYRGGVETRVTTAWVNVGYTFNPVEMSKPKLYDENLTETNTFVRSDTMTVRVDVIHLENASNLTDVTITIADSKDTVKVNNETMESIAEITDGYTYEYNHTIPPDAELGTWTVKVYVSDTSNNHASNENRFLVRASERAGGCPSETKYHGTIHGGIYYDMGGDFGSETLTVTFDDVPAGIQIARVYTGVWGGSGGEGGRFRITVNDNSSTDYCACYNTDDAPAACNAVNEPECHDYATGCGVNFVTYDATPFIHSGSNTVKMETWADSENCCRVGWDGRIYSIALLVVYEDPSMPEITYFINEGAPFMEETCGYDEAFIYFNGAAYPGSTSDMKYWTLGMPNNAEVNPELNENDIGDPDEGGAQYGSGFYLWSDILTSYLNPSSNLFYYYNPGASWERVESAVLMLNHSEPSDLTVTDISIEGGLYADSDATGHYANTVDATVVNNGKTAHFFDVTLYANDTVVDVKRVTNLGEGASVNVSFLWVPTQAGPYLLNVTADAENIVKETNEANNAKTMNVEVTIAPPPAWQSQSSNETQIPNGGTIELRAQGNAELGLDYAVLATDETGTWTNHTNYGSPMDLASYSTDSITHTSDADWNAQIRDNVRVTDGSVMLDKHAGTVNIALDKPAYASSSQADCSPDKANDGIDSTYWASEANEYPCWWYVDLGGVTEVEKIFIDTQYGHHYAIYTSNDGTNWTWKAEKGYAKDETLTNLGWSCRYINVTIIESFDNATSGEIFEFEAYRAVYNPGGTLTSNTVVITDYPVVAVTPIWSLTEPGGTSLSVNISVDDGATWKSAVNGEELTWDYDVHNTTLKYKVLFQTTDVNETPVLHDITLNYTTRDPIESEWLWSNFTWQNPSVTNKTVGWKIYYEDMLGKTNCTDVMTFDVVGADTVAPYTDEHDPAKNATDVPIDTNVSVHIKDYGTGVNKSSIKMTVNDTDVTSALNISGAAADYTVVYAPLVNFGYDQVVIVTVDAADLNETPNVMETDAYHFTTKSQDTLPPYTTGHDPVPGATNVPVDTNISVHVKDDGDGVDNTTITMRVNGEDVTTNLTISGDKKDYTLVYSPPNNFSYGEVVNVTVNASDLALPPNSMTEEYSFTTVEYKPDLIIKSIVAYHYTTAAEPYFNLSNEADITVENIGVTSANESNVSLYISGNFTGKLSVPALGAGNSTTVQFKWTPVGDDCEDGGSPKTYTLKAIADCDGDVEESDEANNESIVQETAYWAGWSAEEDLHVAAQGTLRGGLIYTTGDGDYKGLYSSGATQSTHYDISLPPTVEKIVLARLNVYYTWSNTDEIGVYANISVTLANSTGNTYTLSSDAKYNDRPCNSTPISFDYPYGNYVYDITQYVKGETAITVNVTNAGPAGHDFCPSAPGIVILYEDNTKPLYEYWILEGADILEGGRRGGAGYLSLAECTHNATFTGGVTCNATGATLGMVLPWGGEAWGAWTSYYWFNDHYLGNGSILDGYSSLYDKTVDGMSMYVGESGNAQVGANVSDVTEFYTGADNVVSFGDDGDSMMVGNAFLFVEYGEEEPKNPFFVYGRVFYENETACNGPIVNVTNQNTSKEWQAETNASFNYYQLVLDTANVSAGDMLEFYATDEMLSNTTNHTVTQEDINLGGVFSFNLTLTAPDTTPPASITGLTNVTYEQTYINWTWTDPADADFLHVIVYVDEAFKQNVPKGVQHYNAIGFEPDTEHTIATRTEDTSGNINLTWVNHTAWTSLHPVEEVVDNVTTADIRVKGTVTNDHTYTHTSNDTYESIKEIKQGPRSLLEHKWTIDVISGTKTNITFHLEAHQEIDTGENDHFMFAYSIDDSIYTNMVEVNTSGDVNLTYNLTDELPADFSDIVYIRVRDTDRNKGKNALDTISVDCMFIRSVLGAPDETPPVITNVANTTPTYNSVTITWDTDEPADSLVKYGTASGNYNMSKSNSASVTSHSIKLTELTPNTTYYYVVNSTDPSGNTNESAEYNFKTAEAPTNTMHVASIDMSLSNRTAGKNIFTHATALVTIVNATGVPVENATVHGYWSNATDDVDLDTTNSTGQVSLDSDEVKSASGKTFTFTVDDVAKTGWAWDGIEKRNSTTVP